jgi:anti-sigma factor RsiW
MSEARQPTEGELQAYADGRVDPDQKAAIDAWLAEHPDEAERIEAYRRFGEDLRTLYAAPGCSGPGRGEGGAGRHGARDLFTRGEASG